MRTISKWLRFVVASVAVAAWTYGAIPARATDVIAEWSTIQIPPPPALKPVTVDPKSTALLLLDFMTENCGQRPRCVAAIPTLKALHDRARDASMLVAYTLPGGGKIIDEGIAPREGEVVDQKPGGPDKFLGDDLDQRLKSHGIKTVIVCGTSAQGVGIGTGAAAAHQPSRYWIGPGQENNGNAFGSFLCCQCRVETGDNHSHLKGDQFSGKPGQSLHLAICPASFDYNFVIRIP